MTEVQWPGKAYDPEGSDLSGPIRQLLQDMGLLEERSAEGGGKKVEATLLGGTPPGLQVVTAGALAMSKWMTALITALGGGVGVVAAIQGFWTESAETLKVTYVASAAACVVGAAVAIAVIVSSDVAARSNAMAAEYRARAGVAAALLNSLQYGRPVPPPAPPPTGYYVKKKFNGRPEPKWSPVDGFEHTPDIGVVAVVGGEKLTGQDIGEWITHTQLMHEQAVRPSG